MSLSILVTGGAGFIGSHMVDRLVALGHEVVVVDNETTGSRRNLNPAAHFILGDVTRSQDLEKAFALKLDAVFHIAGQASTFKSFENPGQDLRTNVGGTLQVLEKCMEHRVPRLLYASSMVVYGHPDALPVAENALPCPISYYGVTKYAAERYVHIAGQRQDLGFKLNVTSFRMFNVYGERQNLNNPYQGVVAIFIGNVLRGEPVTIFGDGDQSRDFIHIDDVVDAWTAALNNEDSYGRTFNLGTGQRRTINELVDVVLAAFGKSRSHYPVRYDAPRPGDQRHMQADVSLAHKVLGWQPHVPFDEGMRRTIQWASRQL